MNQKRKEKATELYKQVLSFREHCIEVEGKTDFAIVGKEELDSYNILIDSYSKQLNNKHLETYKFDESMRRVSSSTGYIFLPPQSVFPKISFLLKFLETKYGVSAVSELQHLRDKELRDRLLDLVSLDRPIDTITREITTIVENRIRSLSGKTTGSPEELLSPSSKGSTWLSLDVETKGYVYYLAKAFFKKPRNDSHHSLSDDKEKKNVMPLIYLADEILFYLEPNI